ncbi:MAG: GntR family transcriptional regulator [Janthinobacterium lividum]
MTVDDPTATKQPRRTALRANTLMESVYQEILGRLQRGQLGGDDRILDYEVAQEFACTRMPVRQALLRLVNEGYLVGTTRGFVLPVLTEQDVREIFDVRRLLEPRAAASVVADLNDAQLSGLTAAYRKCRRAAQKRDVTMMTDANITFRSIWLDGIKNVRLKGEILRFSDHTMQVRLSTLPKPGTGKLIADGMERLLEGFLARDAAKVRQASEAFLDDAEHQYFLES